MKINHIAVAITLALTSSAVFAGATSPAPVTVTVNADGSGTAGGSLSSARRSADSVQYIGCGIRYSTTSTGTFKSGFCQASTAAGVVGFCNLDTSDVTNALSMIADYSYLTFSWNTAGICNRIGVSTQSFYIP